jgi:SPP1 family predicted phage head-tail adaptor
VSTIASLRHRLTVERRVSVPGEEDREEWVGVALLWASLEPTSGSEGVVSDRLRSSVTHKARFRYRPGITPDLRLRLGARLFNIVSVIDEGERGRFLVCHIEERSS